MTMIALGLPLMTALLLDFRASLGLQNVLMIYLTFAVAVGTVGGVAFSVVGTCLSLLLLDWYFVPPFHRLGISSDTDVVALTAFIIVTGTVSVLVDISARRMAKAKRDEFRTILLSAVSHDLRTPLSSIKVASSSLRDSAVVWDEESRASLVRVIDREAEKMEALVTDLLDVSRLRLGGVAVQSQSYTVEEALTAVLESVGSRSNRVELDVLEGLPSFTADPALLERVLVNLTENALRFAPADTAVRISAEQERNMIRLSIIDVGPGIKAADKQRVFVPFERLGNSTASGVGLGLAVAKGFVEAMDGTLTAVDTVAGGTTMVVELPVSGRP